MADPAEKEEVREYLYRYHILGQSFPDHIFLNNFDINSDLNEVKLCYQIDMKKIQEEEDDRENQLKLSICSLAKKDIFDLLKVRKKPYIKYLPCVGCEASTLYSKVMGNYSIIQKCDPKQTTFFSMEDMCNHYYNITIDELFEEGLLVKINEKMFKLKE